MAKAKGWNKVEWSFDALEVIKEINSSQEPSGWETSMIDW